MAYLESGDNPAFGSGAQIDPDEFLARFRAGVPRDELVQLS